MNKLAHLSLNSLQTRLTFALVGVTLSLWMIVLIYTGIKTSHEISELLDAHLAQTASVLASTVGEADDDDFTLAPMLHKYQPRVAYQIWHKSDLFSRSSQAPSLPMMPLGELGLNDVEMNGQQWRVFATEGHESHVWIQVAEKTEARQAIVWAGLKAAFTPMLLSLPIMLILIGLVIRWLINPLMKLSDQVRAKRAQDSKPFSVEGVPSEVKPLVLALNAWGDRVNQALQREQQLTADAAHELRTPVAAMRMQAQVALGSLDESQRQQALEQVIAAADKASHVISQLLELARLEKESDNKAFMECDAVAETQNVVAMLISAHALDRVDHLELDAPSQLRIQWDPALLSILVRNLLDNAIRYAGDRGPIRLRWVESVDAGIRFEVEDSGPGLTESEQLRLGQRFYRGTDHQHHKGSGLGWSIIQEICRHYQLTWKVSTSDLGGLKVSIMGFKSAGSV